MEQYDSIQEYKTVVCPMCGTTNVYTAIKCRQCRYNIQDYKWDDIPFNFGAE